MRIDRYCSGLSSDRPAGLPVEMPARPVPQSARQSICQRTSDRRLTSTVGADQDYEDSGWLQNPVDHAKRFDAKTSHRLQGMVTNAKADQCPTGSIGVSSAVIQIPLPDQSMEPTACTRAESSDQDPLEFRGICCCKTRNPVTSVLGYSRSVQHPSKNDGRRLVRFRGNVERVG